MPVATEVVRVASVVDGDSLRLVSGERLRLVNVNAPEMTDRGVRESMARQAQAFLKVRATEADTVAIKRYGQDRFNRTLAEVFVDGRHLGERLLSQGLAWRIAVPPAINEDPCLARAEQQARRQQRGLWSLPPLLSTEAGVEHQGFVLLRGQVESLTAAGDSLWIDLQGDVVLQLADQDRRYFAGAELPRPGQVIEVRGWLRHRRPPRPQFASMVMALRHPAMWDVPVAPQGQ